MNRSKYKNEYQKENYDRVWLLMPKGQKDQIRNICNEAGISMNEYLYMLVCDDLASGQSRLLKKKQGFSEEQKILLQKWQVPAKYYDMIEDLSYDPEEGYYIYLKQGYINDSTGSRTIICRTTKEVRIIISKTHKK